MLSSLGLSGWMVAASVDSSVVIRINQVGYLPDAPKVAVVCTNVSTGANLQSFIVRDEAGRVVLGPRNAGRSGAFGPCTETWRLDFSTVRKSGRYTIEVGAARSPVVRIGRDYRYTEADFEAIVAAHRRDAKVTETTERPFGIVTRGRRPA